MQVKIAFTYRNDKGNAADGRVYDWSTNRHKLICGDMCRFVDRVFLVGVVSWSSRVER